MESRKISEVVLLGDSLMDRGAMYEKKLFGFIPMRWITGLQGKTGGDSFTNGFTWSDYFIAALASEFTIKKLNKEKLFDASDIADAIINNDTHVKSVIGNYYNLKNHASVDFLGKSFIQDYTEGGLTAHDYSWTPSCSISRFFTRLILSTLASKRKELLQYNRKYNISSDQKAKTLIIEWSGANDLITANAKPSKYEVDQAIRARVENIHQLIENGYYNFVLFNQPDLALTPRFQAKNAEERAEATRWCHYFNRRLAIACANIRKDHSDCVIEIFDVAAQFRNLYHNPEKYGLDRHKLGMPFTKSKDFVIKKDGTSPANGYMFWDDVHPTADAHARLGEEFFAIFKHIFDFVEPSAGRQVVYTDDLGMSYPHKKPKATAVRRCRVCSFFSDQTDSAENENRFRIGKLDKGKEKEIVNDRYFSENEEIEESEENEDMYVNQEENRLRY